MASSNEPEEIPQIVSFRVIAESRKIAIIMRGGDVVMASIDDEDTPVCSIFSATGGGLDHLAG